MQEKSGENQVSDAHLSYGWWRGIATVATAIGVASVVMLVLDLAFLGIIAKPFYDQALGSLRSVQVYWPAALAFYIFYVGALVSVAVLPVRRAQCGRYQRARFALALRRQASTGPRPAAQTSVDRAK